MPRLPSPPRHVFTSGLLAGLLCLTTLIWIGTVFHFSSIPSVIDFKLYLAAASIGINHGWAHIYDLALQRPKIIGLFAPEDPGTPFASPPLVAVLASPFTKVAEPIAQMVWSGLVFSALFVACFLAAPDRRISWRLIFATLAITTPTAAIATVSGNVAGFVCMLVVLSWFLLERRRDWAAGIVMGLATMKPQLILILPLVLIVSRRLLALTTFVATTLLIAALSFLLVGQDGLNQYLSILHQVSGLAGQRSLTPSGIFHEPLITVIRGLAIGSVLLTTWLSRSHSLDLPFASAIAASLIVTPYLNPPDLFMLAVATLLVLRAESSLPTIAMAIAVLFELEVTAFSPDIGGLFACEALIVAVTLWVSSNRRSTPALHSPGLTA